jgi:hypothetical protein
LLGVIALVISLAALAVACASVYINNLAPAAIALDPIRMPARDELPTGGYTPSPQAHDLWLAFFVSNTGARGGLLRSVEVSAADAQPEADRFWAGVVSVHGPLRQQNPGLQPLGAVALEAGDVQTIWLMVHLQPRAEGPEAQARRMRNLETLAVKVSWTIVRTHPLRPRRRQTVTRFLELEVDARHYREHAVAYWRSMANTALLADIAEGRAEPPE